MISIDNGGICLYSWEILAQISLDKFLIDNSLPAYTIKQTMVLFLTHSRTTARQ